MKKWGERIWRWILALIMSVFSLCSCMALTVMGVKFMPSVIEWVQTRSINPELTIIQLSFNAWIPLIYVWLVAGWVAILCLYLTRIIVSFL